MTAIDDTSGPRVEVSVDGRTLRRTRNRIAVIDSLLAIIREGNLHPGATAIADRAGVSNRSIFRYFDDLDDLALTAIGRAFELAQPTAEIPRCGEGTFTDRVERLVTARLELFQQVDGTMRLAAMRAPTIPLIDEGLAAITAVFAARVELHFATELAARPVDQRRALVDGVIILTSWYAYSIHLRQLHHNVDQMHTAMTSALVELLGS